MATDNAGSKTSIFKWLLLLVAVVAAIAVFRGVLLTRNKTAARLQDAATAQSVEERIKPLGNVSIAPPQPRAATVSPPALTASAVEAPPASAAVPAIAAAVPFKAGESTYHALCTGCHSIGAMGAPRYGDKAAWAPRIAQGMDVLYHSALNGKNAMPAKGGNPKLSDAEVKAAVDYMVAAAR